VLFATSVFGQGKVEIVGGERMTFNQSRNHLYIVQNVVIKHNGVIIQCDSAIRKMDEGIIEGFGHIYIYQPDTFTLSGGEILVYHEDSKVATVTGKSVQLSDQKMTLTTTSLNCNTQTQTGFYSNGADILNDGTQLKSKKGFYFRRGNQFFFKDNVNNCTSVRGQFISGSNKLFSII
jgi:lipopolysaccharide assembly outer membrane protein LptD (OstA)